MVLVLVVMMILVVMMVTMVLVVVLVVVMVGSGNKSGCRSVFKRESFIKQQRLVGRQWRGQKHAEVRTGRIQANVTKTGNRFLKRSGTIKDWSRRSDKVELSRLGLNRKAGCWRLETGESQKWQKVPQQGSDQIRGRTLTDIDSPGGGDYGPGDVLGCGSGDCGGDDPGLSTLQVGLVLNSFTLRVYFCGGLLPSSSVTIYLKNLAAADFFISLCLPVRIAHYASASAHLHVLYCSIGAATFYLNMYASILFMGYIAANRWVRLQGTAQTSAAKVKVSADRQPLNR